MNPWDVQIILSICCWNLCLLLLLQFWICRNR